MRQLLNMTADFSNALAMQGIKTAGFSFSSKNAAEIPSVVSGSGKSFDALVDDARRNSGVSAEAERNVSDAKSNSCEKQEISGEMTARKPENSVQDGKTSEEKEIFGGNPEKSTEKKSGSSKDSLGAPEKNQIADGKSLSSGKNVNDFTVFSRIPEESQNALLENSEGGKKASLSKSSKSGKNLTSENLNPKLSKKTGAESSVNEQDPEIVSNLQGGAGFITDKNGIGFDSDSFDLDSGFAADGDFSLHKKSDRQGRTFSLDKDGKITVNDLRTEDSEAKNTKQDSKLEIKNVKFDGKNSLQMDLNLPEQNFQNASQNILSSSTQSSSSVSSNFQAMLQNQIQANADSFVKAGNIVLKNNDVGEIKLILHPESLGNVKIDLHLKDNTISGKIIVQTQEAFEAFKESAENLKQAFISSGFEASGFDLSFAGERQGGNQFYENENQQSKMKMAFAYEGGFSDENDAEGRGYFSEDYPTNSVNIVA